MADDSGVRIGWIGAGAIGLAMLKRLIAAGHDVICCDIDPVRERLAREEGARIAVSPAALADASDAIFLCLPNGKTVAEVVFGSNGCAVGGMSDKLIIDTSSLDPVITRQLTTKLTHDTGGRWLDAPVSGGVSGAAQGTLVALLGGLPDDVARARPWISAFANRIVHLGPVGCGQWAKMCNQAIICGTIALWTEALALGCAGGIEPYNLVAALEGASADLPVRRSFGKDLASGNFMPSANLQKDIATALERAGDGRREMLEATARVFDILRDQTR